MVPLTLCASGLRKHDCCSQSYVLVTDCVVKLLKRYYIEVSLMDMGGIPINFIMGCLAWKLLIT
jgi:hypothetical protein